MRLLLIFLMGMVFNPSISWQTDIEKAEQSAKTEHKFIVLNFSGSDWCGPCIRLHKEVFDSEVFTNYASGHLVLVNADFPGRRKTSSQKNSKRKMMKWPMLITKTGVFPLTLLLNPDGKVLKRWDGFPKESAEELTSEINAVVDAAK